MDRWIRQLTLTAMLLAALGLLVTAVALYAPRAHARAHVHDPARGLVPLNLPSIRDPWGHEYVYRLESGRPVLVCNGVAGGAPLVGCPDGCPPGYATTESEEEAK